MSTQSVFQINLTLIDDIIIKLVAVDQNNQERFQYENSEGIAASEEAMKLLNLTKRKNTRFVKAQDLKKDKQRLIKWVIKDAELLIIDFFNKDDYLGNVVFNSKHFNASHLPLALRYDFDYTYMMAKLNRKVETEIKPVELYHLNGQRLHEHAEFKKATRIEIIDTYYY